MERDEINMDVVMNNLDNEICHRKGKGSKDFVSACIEEWYTAQRNNAIERAEEDMVRRDRDAQLPYVLNDAHDFIDKVLKMSERRDEEKQSIKEAYTAAIEKIYNATCDSLADKYPERRTYRPKVR